MAGKLDQHQVGDRLDQQGVGKARLIQLGVNLLHQYLEAFVPQRQQGPGVLFPSFSGDLCHFFDMVRIVEAVEYPQRFLNGQQANRITRWQEPYRTYPGQHLR